MKTIKETAKILGVHRNAISDWIVRGKAKPDKIKLGKRTMYGFSNEEIARLKKQLKPKNQRIPGQSILRDE